MSSTLWKYSVVVATLLAVMSVTAEAEVCGDADGSETVTVTDGVQTLRAAAGLSSTCDSRSTCDVDGSGKVTVTDGVNVLRKAADLSITENCGGVDGVDAVVEASLGPALPTLLPVVQLFGSLTKLSPITQAKMGASAQAAEASPCPNGGTLSFDQATGEITFVDCDFGGGTAVDGFLAPGVNTISFDIDFTDVNDEFISLAGDLTTEFPSGSGGNSVLNGSLTIDSSNLDLISSIDVKFEDIVSDPKGNVIGGSLLLDASDSGIEGVVGIRVGAAPTTIVPVEVIFDAQPARNFTFDTESGELTPVSN